jgi:hypothetical protein
LVEAFKIVELLAQVEDGRSDLVPQWRKWPALQARQWRHAEIEPAITLAAAPQHQLREQEIHDAAHTCRIIAHQVDRDLVPALDLPQVCERHYDTLGIGHHRDPRTGDVGLIEEAEREALLVRLLVHKPKVGDLPKARHGGGGFGRVQDPEREAVLGELVAGVAQILPLLSFEREAL